MDAKEVRIGEAVYEIHRVYTGERQSRQLILEKLMQSKWEKTAFDDGSTDAL